MDLQEYIDQCTTALNYNTQKAKHFVRAYAESTWCELCECYNSYSSWKESAYNGIVAEMQRLRGHGVVARDLRIIGASCMTFSTGYRVSDGGSDYLIIDTRCNTYSIRVPDKYEAGDDLG